MDVKRSQPDPDPEPPSSKKMKAPPTYWKAPPTSSSAPGGDGEQGGLAAGEKVCIVCTCNPGEEFEDQRDEFRIYIVDSYNDNGSRGFKLRAPTLRLARECVSAQTFCVLDSVLYIFGGSSPMGTRPPLGGKSVFTLKLSSNFSSCVNHILAIDDLVKIDDMHDFKYLPVAISTPDRKKILVFSTRFTECCDDDGEPYDDDDDDGCDFEIYDAVRQSWDELVGIPDSWRIVDFCINGYTFLDDNVMLFQTDNIGMFTLDVTSPHQPCQKYAPPLPVALPPDGCSITIGDAFYLTPVLAYDKQECFDYPELSLLGPMYIRPRRLITPLDASDSEFKFCVLQSEINTATLRPHVILNIYRFDLEEYKGKKGQMEYQGMKNSIVSPILPATTILKSVKFRLHVEVVDGWGFEPFCLFYIPAEKPT